MPVGKVSLRPFTPADLPAYEAWRAAIDARQYMSRFHPRAFDGTVTASPGLFAWYVIAADGEDVGTVWLEKDGPQGSTATLGILIGRPDLLGVGIGQEAIPLAIARARATLGFDEVRLNVRKGNARAIACYKQCGFAIAAEGSKTRPARETIEFYEMRLSLGERTS